MKFPYSSSIRFLITLSIVFSLRLNSQIHAEEKSSRLIAGLHSAQALIDDMEYIISEIAGRKNSYDEGIFATIDTFIYGVGLDESVRMDLVFSEEFGLEYQVLVPYLDLDEFLKDNLDPIDIIADKKKPGLPRNAPGKNDRELYEVYGNVYVGWMRIFKDPDYAVFFPRREGIPKDMPHPAKLDDELVKKGYGLFAHLKNDAKNVDGRNTAFEATRSKAVDALKKSTEETKNEYELRKKFLDLQLSIVQQWFAESTGFTAGTLLDKKNATLNGDLSFAAIPETELEESINRIHNEASYFAPIQSVEDPALSARMHLAYDARTASLLVELFNLSRLVAEDLIDENKDLDDAQKAARKKVANLFNEVMVQSSELGVIDSFVDINPDGDVHTFLMGIRCQGQAQLEEMLNELPNGQRDWKLEKDVDEVEGVKIHKVSIDAEIPESLVEMYGEPAGVSYVAVSDKAFWLAFGANSLEELKKGISTVRTAEDVVSNDIVLSFHGHAQPLADSIGDVLNDDSNLLGTLFAHRQRSTGEGEGETDDEEGAGRQAATSFLTFEWITKVAESMKSEDDSVHLELKYTEENTLSGTATAHKGLLKAVGTMIANFADETLQ